MKKSVLTITLFLIIISGFSQKGEDWANLSRYKNANKELLQTNSNQPRVVFIGNSITDHWISKHPDFFKNKNYINRGISGQTSPQMLVRFRADVVQLNPKVVVLLCGTNDIAGNTGPSTLEMIEDNIASMCEISKANNIKVILSAVLPVYQYPWKKELKPALKIVNLNRWLKNYASINGHIYLDYFTACVNSKNGMKDELAYDGVHPNSEGYFVMEKLVELAIVKALE